MAMDPPPPAEPPAVLSARRGVARFQSRLKVYLGGIGLTALGILAAAFSQTRVLIPYAIGLYALWTVGGIAILRPGRLGTDRKVLEEWDSRQLREEFARFDQISAQDDPRLGAAASMAHRIRALPGSPAGTEDMVTGLQQRLTRLVTDANAAGAAVQALRAAGAGEQGVARLAAAAEHLEAEIARVLGGLSDLYAALLEAETGGEEPALREVMAWLEAEAEIARATSDEAMRSAPDRPARAQQRS